MGGTEFAARAGSIWISEPHDPVAPDMDAQRGPFRPFPATGEADQIADDRGRWGDAFETHRISEVFHAIRTQLLERPLRAKFGRISRRLVEARVQAKCLQMMRGQAGAICLTPFKGALVIGVDGGLGSGDAVDQVQHRLFIQNCDDAPFCLAMASAITDQPFRLFISTPQ